MQEWDGRGGIFDGPVVEGFNYCDELSGKPMLWTGCLVVLFSASGNDCPALPALTDHAFNVGAGAEVEEAVEGGKSINIRLWTSVGQR